MTALCYNIPKNREGFALETRKLFYEDCHRKEFVARVTSCRETEKGYLVTLDATAFYPEGGGQASDTGMLGNARVIHVQEQGEEILHLCDRALVVGEPVQGVIDYDRRFDLMQQHTGEHILSGIIHRRFGYHNVGFHMGKEFIEIDFDGPITQDEIAQIEAEANAVIWQNFPIKCWYPSEEELPSVSYRSKRALPWPVRIVEVPGIDSCACCGVHVESTGEVGVIKIVSCVKFHEGVRLEILCGGRAYRYVSAVWEQNRQVSQSFSAKMLETAEAARKMNELLAAEKLRAGSMMKKWFGAIAESYVNCGDVLYFAQELKSGEVRELADLIAETCGGRAAVFSGTDGEGYSFCMVSRKEDLRSLGKELTAALNGRGGGKPECQQGTVSTSRAEIEAFFNK